jgi:hypothetical protein
MSLPAFHPEAANAALTKAVLHDDQSRWNIRRAIPSTASIRQSLDAGNLWMQLGNQMRCRIQYCSDMLSLLQVKIVH